MEYSLKRIEQDLGSLEAGYIHYPERIRIDKPVVKIENTNNKYLLVSENLDIGSFARLEIVSEDNVLVTSKEDYKNSAYSIREKIFTGDLLVSITDYKQFIPFYLEFILIIPQYKQLDGTKENK